MRLLPALLTGALAAPAWAGAPEIEIGVENFYYKTAETALNRGNLLDLETDEDLLRGALGVKQSLGAARLVFRGYVERDLVSAETTGKARQAWVQYAWGPGLQLRAGKQRIAWGSGFAWNPTNRIEPPKNPANTSLEQEGALAARMDWIPVSWAGVILVAARGDTGLGDRPFDPPAETRTTAAIRARFLVRDTDLALVFSGGKNQRTLVGFDLGRDLFGRVSVHAESALYRGSEIGPPRDDEVFFRLATGLLYTRDTAALGLEYFWNGEGKGDAEADAYLDLLERTYAAATDPRLPSAARDEAFRAYARGAGAPYSGGLGLRQHYLHAFWTRSEIRGEWTASLRGVFGLSDGGIALTPGFAWAPRGDLTLSVDGIVLLGPGQSEYRLTPLRGAVQARVKALF